MAHASLGSLGVVRSPLQGAGLLESGWPAAAGTSPTANAEGLPTKVGPRDRLDECEHGWDDVEFLQTMSGHALETLAETVGMKAGHVMRFKMLLRPDLEV